MADFRSRDVAAGGQGAPLVPAFHQAMFAQAGQTVAVLNIGGISNLSRAARTMAVLGFDCGPGNALMDAWCQQHTGQPFDAEGRWAASGHVHAPLLQALLQEPYLALPPPKSTGRDLFNPAWLADKLTGFASAAPRGCAGHADRTDRHRLRRRSCSAMRAGSTRLIVCGGGALNNHLMQRLQARLPNLTRGLLGAGGPAAAAGGGGRLCLAGAQDRAARNGEPEKRHGRPRRPCAGCIYPA